MEPTSLPDAVTSSSSERERRQIFTTDQSDEPIVMDSDPERFLPSLYSEYI